MNKLYRQIELTHEQLDTYVFAHQMAMTSESLHSKAEIAAELGSRDVRIAELEKKSTKHIEICERHVSTRKYLEKRIAELEEESADAFVEFTKNYDAIDGRSKLFVYALKIAFDNAKGGVE